MIKFSVFGQGLLQDVQRRYENYLHNDPMKLITTIACSLLDSANIKITNELLERMGLLQYAYSLNNLTLYYGPDESWKTINAKWDIELLSFLYNEPEPSVLFKRVEYLREAIKRIFNLNDENIAGSVMLLIYDIASLEKISTIL